MPLFFVLSFCTLGNCSKCVISCFVISRTTSFNFLVYEPIKNQLKPFKCQEMVLDIFLFPNLIFLWHDIQFKIISIIKLSFSCQTMRTICLFALHFDHRYLLHMKMQIIGKKTWLRWLQYDVVNSQNQYRFYDDNGEWNQRFFGVMLAVDSCEDQNEPLFFWKRLWWQFWHKLGEQVTTTASNICHEKLKK